MEKIELTWSGLKIFDAVTIEAVPENICGVYRLSHRHTDNNIYVFFVGKSDDIKTQLKHHLSTDESNICIKNYLVAKQCYFKYAEFKDLKQLDAVYSQLYKFYQPGCNDKLPVIDESVTINVN
jgi:hypothetical protein